MLPQDFVIAIPRQPSPARAATQPFLPYPTEAPIELLKTAVVRRSSVVLVVAAELGVQGFPLLVHRLVPVLLGPGGDRLQSPAEPFADRLHVHGELPLPAAGAHVGKAEELEGLGFLSLFLRVPPRISPKFHQPRLLRVKGQTKFAESLGYDFLHLFRVLLVFEAQDGIV